MKSDAAMLPDTMKVPADHKGLRWKRWGVDLITYECRAKKDMAGQVEWAFDGPDARLVDHLDKQVGKYFGPPATRETMDGSQITGKQLAVTPGGAGNIALQFVQANPAVGVGTMAGLTCIQRLKTQGGVAPATACGAANLGAKQTVNDQTDHIFWTAV